MNINKIWTILDGKPKPLQMSKIAKEESLEDWIVANPNIIQQGLQIIGRQEQVENGYIDLLGIDPHDRLIIIENKRGRLGIDFYSQILSYAISINKMHKEKLDNFILETCSKLISTSDQSI